MNGLENVVPREMRQMTHEELVRFWEDRLPGLGRVAADILFPIYNRGLALTPELPDLESRARRAIFWQGWQGMQVFPRTRLTEAYWAAWRLGVYDSYLATTRGPHEPLLRVRVEFPPAREAFISLVGDKLDRSLQSLCEGQVPYDSNPYSVWVGVLNRLRSTVFTALCAPLECITNSNPDKAAAFEELRALLVDGNIPLGFSENGSLIVLVA